MGDLSDAVARQAEEWRRRQGPPTVNVEISAVVLRNLTRQWLHSFYGWPMDRTMDMEPGEIDAWTKHRIATDVHLDGLVTLVEESTEHEPSPLGGCSPVTCPPLQVVDFVVTAVCNCHDIIGTGQLFKIGCPIHDPNSEEYK